MLTEFEYRQIALTKGRAAADAEFDRQMRVEHWKIAVALGILLLLIASILAVSWR